MAQSEKACPRGSTARASRIARALVAIGACLGAWLLAPAVRADALSQADTDRLMHGETVVYRQTVNRGSRHYVGGIAYTLVDASATAITEMLAREETWKRILPRKRSAKHVGDVAGNALIELTQGTALIQATYTVMVQADPGQVRFWIDPRRAHDIEDAWGFLRAEPVADGRSLVTFGVLIDMGGGLLRDMFEEHVSALALTVPDRMRSFIDERNAAGQRAER